MTAACFRFGCFKQVRRTVISAAKQSLVNICFLLLITISLLKVVDIILDKISYPYNMYKGYPLSIYNNPYNINTNKTCSGNTKINMIVVIHSKVTNFDKRATIRNTWGNRNLLSAYNMKLVFFLGMPFRDDIQILVSQEAEEHNDIVQGPYIDSYTNITHKAVLWLRWVSENCPYPPYVLKIDDDVFVNVFSLYHTFIPTHKNSSKTMWCDVNEAQIISRIRGAKWRIAEHELKGYYYYPLPLCRGYFVVLTQYSIRPMYEAAKETPFFWVDDYYVFGILANKTGIQHSSIAKRLSTEKEGYNCFSSSSSVCQLLGVLLEKRDTMKKLWELTLNNVNQAIVQ